MVEVFRTNVQDLTSALRLQRQIEELREGYCVNFDLEDCDRVLRVEVPTGSVDAAAIAALLAAHGFTCAVLPDELPEVFPS